MTGFDDVLRFVGAMTVFYWAVRIGLVLVALTLAMLDCAFVRFVWPLVPADLQSSLKKTAKHSPAQFAERGVFERFLTDKTDWQLVDVDSR